MTNVSAYPGQLFFVCCLLREFELAICKATKKRALHKHG